MLTVAGRCGGVGIIGADGSPLGGGLQLTTSLVATCAHVVAAALGSDPAATAKPAGELDVEIRDTGAAALRRPARVRRWLPVRQDDTGDIAVLTLGQALHTTVPPLFGPDRLWGRRFCVTSCSFGDGPPITVTGELRAGQGTGWTQLRADPGGVPITAGFSGSPVWDEQTGAVVGITVAADLNPAWSTAYMIPVQDVCRLEPETIGNPYRGLAPFREADADLFCGREADIARLSEVLDRERFAVVVGPSGVGKSSLVRAGLLPMHRATGAHVIDLAASRERPEQLLGTLDAVGCPPAESRPDVLVVADQFEELVAADPPAAREVAGWLTRLVDHRDRRVRVVMTLRWADLGEIVTESTARWFDAGVVPVAPLQRSRLREAVTVPLARAPGLYFERGLVEQICDDAGRELGQLPLIEVVLRRLAAEHDGGLMSREAYDRLGGVRGAIDRLAAEAVAGLDADDHTHMRTLLTSLVTVDGDSFIRRRRRMAELDPAERRVADLFVRQRLLVIGDSDGEPAVELAHQALIEHWPTLRTWLEEDRVYLAWLSETTRRRSSWTETGHDPGALLRGTSLAAAQEWLAERPNAPPEIRDYLDASAAQARRESRRRRRLAIAVSAAVAAAAVLGSLLVYQLSVAESHEVESRSRQLAALSAASATNDPSFSAMLALSAYRQYPTDEALRALRQHYLEYDAVDAVLSGGLGPVNAVDASADAGVVAASTGSGTVTIWDRRDPAGVSADRLPADGNVTTFRVTADGGAILGLETLGPGQHVVFAHDVSSGERRWEVRFEAIIDSVTLGDEQFGVILGALRGERRTQQLWDHSGPQPRLIAERDEFGPLQEIHGFGPEPGMVALRSLPREGSGFDIQLWDSAARASQIVATNVPLAGLGYWVDGHDWVGPDGATPVCDDTAGELRVISVTDGSTIRQVPLPAGEQCHDVVVDDGSTLAVGNSLAVDLTTARAVRQPEPRPASADRVEIPATDPLQRARRLAVGGPRPLTILHDSRRIIVTEVHRADPTAGTDAGPGSDAAIEQPGRSSIVLDDRPDIWAESVCAAIERASFTEAELTALPDWMPAEPPC